jgi:hypothetical protein
MVAKYYINTSINCVFIRHAGEFIAGEGPENMGEILADADYRPGMNFLRDASRTKLPAEFGYEYFKRMQSQGMGGIEKQLGGCKMAWLVDNGHDFAVVHQLSVSERLTPDAIERRPFRDIEAVLEWLGLPADYEFKYPED